MPRAIAIDTAGREGSIVAIRDGTIGPERLFPHGLGHAAGIVTLIDSICQEYRWTARELEQLFLSVGPGSFTGLRIAVTVAKMVALTCGTKLVAVPTPRALVENAPDEAREVITVADAKRSEIFTARYRRASENDWQEIEPPHLDRLTAMLERAGRPVHLVGEGISYHADSIPSDQRIVVTPPSAWRSRAAVIARLGLRFAAGGEFVDPQLLTPAYIRRPEAEEKWLSTQDAPQ